MSTFEPVILSDFLLNRLSLNPHQSLQLRIYQLIQQAVMNGQLIAGAKLPSTRQLAADIGLSRMTITLAYDKLSAEGYIVCVRGKGTFVAQTNPIISSSSVKPSESHQHKLSARGSSMISGSAGVALHSGAFVPGVVETTDFPFSVWQRMQNRFNRHPRSEMTGYDSCGGYMPLRESLAHYLQISRSVKCRPEQILITMGSNQSLSLCAQMLADPNDFAIVEEPCNWSTALLWQAAGLNIIPVPVDDQGINIEQFSFSSTSVSAIPKLVFTSPSHQYPMGVALTLARRRLLTELAEKYDFWIIEDDYDSEFRFDKNPLVNTPVLVPRTF